MSRRPNRKIVFSSFKSVIDKDINVRQADK